MSRQRLKAWEKLQNNQAVLDKMDRDFQRLDERLEDLERQMEEAGWMLDDGSPRPAQPR